MIDKLGTVAGAVGWPFWAFVVLAGTSVVLLALRKIDKKIKFSVMFAAVVFFFFVSIMVNDKFYVSETMSGYGITSVFDPEDKWNDFLAEEFGYVPGINLMADHWLRRFASEKIQGDYITDTISIKEVNLGEAKAGSYRILCLYEECSLPESIAYEPTLFAHLVPYPTKVFYFDQKIREHNISKSDNLLLYCDNEEQTKAVAIIFAFRGYNVSYAINDNY
jgi:hypothetical protein